jgi:hypothetical protein
MNVDDDQPLTKEFARTGVVDSRMSTNVLVHSIPVMLGSHRMVVTETQHSSWEN